MHRLLILLLIFLLPMQVFAGMPESTENAQTNFQVHVMTTPSYTIQQNESAAQCSAADSQDFQGSEDNTVDEIEMHVDLGDETVPAFRFIFAATAIASIHALSNDKARQPPFLPPSGPPPKV